MIAPLKAEVNNQTLAILVNENDPESIEIARYYQKARSIPENNIIYLSFKHNINSLSEGEFKIVEKQLEKNVTDNIEAYALAWRKPWRVGCMSITSAFSLGYNKEYCADGCKVTKAVTYFNSQSKRPYGEFGIRPSMMLSAESVQGVKKLIDIGVSADYSRPIGTAYLLSTHDKQRNVRSVYYSNIEKIFDNILSVEVIKADAIRNKNNVLFYFTGLEKVKWLNENTYLPGAIADHLTSTGGHLFKGKQMSVLKWIEAGVTGTYGTVVEPCNFTQKFPNPGIVMQKYLSGNSLIEAYWKSVKMPGQGLFVGEPLASPFKGCSLEVNKFKDFKLKNYSRNNYVELKNKNCNLNNFNLLE